jgi:hypothetical protein
MKAKQIIAYLLFSIAIAMLIGWFACGHHPWTTTQSMIEVKTTDELFGTTVTTQKWVDDFTPGLEWTGPTAAIFIGAGVWLMIAEKKKSRRQRPTA